LDVRQPSPGLHAELVLQLPGLLAHHQIHPRPELTIDDLLVAGQTRTPPRRILAAEVVDLSRHLLLPFHYDSRIGLKEPQGEADTARRRLFGSSIRRQKLD